MQAIYFHWKKYAGLLPTGMRRLKEFEDQNSWLKKIVADLTLGREMLQVKAVCRPQDPTKDLKLGRMPELDCGMCRKWAVSIRMACAVIGFDRSTFQ